MAARTLHGILDELMLAPARARATYARLIDVAVVPGAVGSPVTAARSPGTSDFSPWLPRSLTTVRPGASGGIPNGSLSPCTISTGTVTASSSASRVFSGRPGG